MINYKDDLLKIIESLFQEYTNESNMLEYVDFIDDLNMDSITFISMVIEIENKFNIEVPDNLLLMEFFKNLDSIVKMFEQEILKHDEMEDVSDV
jgi:Phosphopantetheine attachment site.